MRPRAAASTAVSPVDTAALLKDSDHWRTPPSLVDKLVAFAEPAGGIALDPCGSPAGTTQTVDAKHVVFFPEDDGLTADWLYLVTRGGSGRVGGGIAFANPPYSAQLIAHWVRKVIDEAQRGVEIVLLVQASLGVRWFNLLCEEASRGLEIGRVKFEGADQGARFVSALFYFGGRSGEFMRVFGDMGRRLT